MSACRGRCRYFLERGGFGREISLFRRAALFGVELPGQRADVILSSNPGCLLQLTAGLQRAHRTLPVLHMVELLDASIRGTAASLLNSRAEKGKIPA